MTEFENVDYTVADQVATVTINRPKAMNSFNTALRNELAAVLKKAAQDDAVRVIVLTGKERAFSAGADLKDIDGREKSVEWYLQKEYRPSLDAIASMEKPVIAAVNGSAAGIGLSYAMICDLAVMADNAFLLAPFSSIGLVPDGGANWLLVNQIGYKRAFQLCVEAERIDAERCLQWGLVNKVVPAESLLEETLAWAKKIAARAPLSVGATKKAMRHAVASDWASTFDLEASMQDALMQSEDCQEGVSAFLEKRQATYKGR